MERTSVYRKSIFPQSTLQNGFHFILSIQYSSCPENTLANLHPSAPNLLMWLTSSFPGLFSKRMACTVVFCFKHTVSRCMSAFERQIKQYSTNGSLIYICFTHDLSCSEVSVLAEVYQLAPTFMTCMIRNDYNLITKWLLSACTRVSSSPTSSTAGRAALGWHTCRALCTESETEANTCVGANCCRRQILTTWCICCL